VGVDATGFNERAAIAVIDRNDAIHAAEADHDATCDRKNGAAEAGAGAAWDNGKIIFGAKFNDGSDFLGVFWKNDGVRLHFFQRVSVALVNNQFGGIGQETVGADDGTKRFDERNRER
jgi:hypothetical protein